jgi:hypothetical protein
VQNHIRKARTKKITEEMAIKKTNNKEMMRSIIIDGLIKRQPLLAWSKTPDFERGWETGVGKWA